MPVIPWFSSAPVARASEISPMVEVAKVHRALRHHPDNPTIPFESYRAALAGPVAGVAHVEGVVAAQAWGLMVMEVPVESVWMALNDEARMGGRLPVSVSAVIGGKPHSHGRRVFEYLPLPLIVSDRWWVVDMHMNRGLYEASDAVIWELAWTDATSADALVGTPFAEVAAGGVPVAWTRGSWLLYRIDERRTLVEYTSWSDPGGSLPAGPATRFGGGAVKDTLRAVAALAGEAHGRPKNGFVRPDGAPL